MFSYVAPPDAEIRSPSMRRRSSCQFVTPITLRENRSLAKRMCDSHRPRRAREGPRDCDMPMNASASDMEEYRAQLHAWLDLHHDELSPRYTQPGTLDEQVAQMQRVKAQLYDAGWMRYGWPETVGGLGGSPMMRAELGAALAARDLADPGLFSLIEVLAPTLIDFAPSALAAEVVPRLLSGAEMWCQGFSEPGTGSDLASLSCSASPAAGDATGADGRAWAWVINGQKVWTSLAQYSDRCMLLARTGPTDSRHRGITAFFVDMDTPGIKVAPL